MFREDDEEMECNLDDAASIYNLSIDEEFELLSMTGKQPFDNLSIAASDARSEAAALQHSPEK